MYHVRHMYVIPSKFCWQGSSNVFSMLKQSSKCSVLNICTIIWLWCRYQNNKFAKTVKYFPHIVKKICNNFAFFFVSLLEMWLLIVSCLLIRLIMNKSLHTSNRYIGVSFNHFKGGMSKYKYFMTNLAGPHRK